MKKLGLIMVTGYGATVLLYFTTFTFLDTFLKTTH